MAREIVSPEQIDMESPGRRDYWVALGHTSIWGSHLIPLTVMVGPQAKPGEGLVAFGGNHGNEYEGPVAIKHLLREIRTEDIWAGWYWYRCSMWRLSASAPARAPGTTVST